MSLTFQHPDTWVEKTAQYSTETLRKQDLIILNYFFCNLTKCIGMGSFTYRAIVFACLLLQRMLLNPCLLNRKRLLKSAQLLEDYFNLFHGWPFFPIQLQASLSKLSNNKNLLLLSFIYNLVVKNLSFIYNLVIKNFKQTILFHCCSKIICQTLFRSI